MLRLFHISEEENILQFIPRVSKKQWNFQSYVWAIEEKKLHNYLLPRECPRICLSLEKSNIQMDYLNLNRMKNPKAVIFVAEEWKEKINNCRLYQYEFAGDNFKLMDKIAGYYVSDKTEVPLNKIEIKDCPQELQKLDVELILSHKEKMMEIKDKVINDFEEFSIIKWSNLE